MRVKSKKGFTLVELIVVVALVAIMGVAVVSIMTPAGNMYTKMQSQAQAKMLASEVMQVVEPQVRFGTNLSIVSSVASGDSTNRYLYADVSDFKVYEVDKGTKKDLFGSDFYKGYKIDGMTFNSISGTNSVQISITVKSTTDLTITSTLATTIQNLNTASITDNGNILRYQWLPQPSASS